MDIPMEAEATALSSSCSQDFCVDDSCEELEEQDEVQFNQASSSRPDELSDESGSPLFNNNNEQIVRNGDKATFLRPCSMMLMSMTEEDYRREYWPKLQAAITQLLKMKPGEYIPISYEQMYSCVYKCVCKQFTERLYQDLLDHVTSHLCTVNADLQTLKSQPTVYIESFGMALSQYSQALSGIVPIFNYMNRFYVERTLRTNLRSELQTLFISTVADRHVPLILPLMMDCLARPFLLKPSVIADLAKNLHLLKPEYAQLHPHFFAKYIPCILPPFVESDLEAYIKEVKQTTRDLKGHPSFTSGDQSRKRSGDDEFMAFASAKS